MGSMRTRRLGTQGLEVSALGLGTMGMSGVAGMPLTQRVHGLRAQAAQFCEHGRARREGGGGDRVGTVGTDLACGDDRGRVGRGGTAEAEFGFRAELDVPRQAVAEVLAFVYRVEQEAAA